MVSGGSIANVIEKLTGWAVISVDGVAMNETPMPSAGGGDRQ